MITQWLNCLKLPPDESYSTHSSDLFVGRNRNRRITLPPGSVKIRDLVVKGKLGITGPAELSLQDVYVIDTGQITFTNVNVKFRYCFQMTQDQLERAVAQGGDEPKGSAPIPLTSFPVDTFILNGRISPISNPYERYATAAHHGDLATVQLCVAAGIDQQETSEKKSALMWAAEENDVQAVQGLLAAKAQPEATDSCGNTALSYATQKRCPETAECLLAAKANIYARNHFAKTPLMKAVNTGSAKMINLFVKYGADLSKEQPMPGCMSAEVMHAAVNGDIETMQRVLIPHKNDTAIDSGDTALILAARYGHTLLVKWLIQNNADTEVIGISGTALEQAIQYGHDETVFALLNPNTVLHLSFDTLNELGAKETHVKILDHLIAFFYEHQPNIILDLFAMAASLGYEHVIKALLRANIPLNDIVLINAAQKRHTQIVQMLLAAGANGPSALVSCITAGDFSEAEVLENAGIPLDPSRVDGGLLLSYTAMKHDVKKVEELLRAGIDPNIQDAKGRTALIRAIGHADIVHMLLEQNADPNIPDQDGETALSYAAMQGEAETVEKLLAKKANANPPRGTKSLLSQIRELKSKALWPLSDAYKKIILLLANGDSTPAQSNPSPRRLQWAEFLPTKHSPLIESFQTAQTYEEVCQVLDEIIAAFMVCRRKITDDEKVALAQALQNPIIQAHKENPKLQALFDLAKINPPKGS